MKKKMIALAGSLLVVAILVTSVGGVVVAAPQNGGCGEEDCCQEEMGPRSQWRAAGFLRDVMDYLGIAPEDIRELRGECRGPREVLEALGLSQEDVKEAMEAVLEEKVADGVLTQEQADRILERIEKMADRAMDGAVLGPAPWMRGDCDGQPGRGFGPGAFRHWRHPGGEEATPGVWHHGKGPGHMNNCG